jgi:hypothetical protein
MNIITDITATHFVDCLGTLEVSSLCIDNYEAGSLSKGKNIKGCEIRMIDLNLIKVECPITSIERIAATRGIQARTACFVEVLAPAYPVPSQPARNKINEHSLNNRNSKMNHSPQM